jgi:hypothetical protein
MTIEKINGVYVATEKNVSFTDKCRLTAQRMCSAWAWIKSKKSIELEELEEVLK